MNPTVQNPVIAKCKKCGTSWLVASTEKRLCKCGGRLEFPQPPQAKPVQEPKQTRRRKPATAKMIVILRKDEPEPIELPEYIEPLPLDDYEVLMLGAECGSFVLSGSPPREKFKTGELITLISRLWGMALWLEAGRIGGEE